VIFTDNFVGKIRTHDSRIFAKFDITESSGVAAEIEREKNCPLLKEVFLIECRLACALRNSNAGADENTKLGIAESVIANARNIERKEWTMFGGLILWLLGVPLGLIVLLWLFGILG
jgi:hypothetical protein